MADTNSDLRQLAVSGIRRFNALASAVPGCVKLTLGEPEFDSPAPVKEAVSRSLAEGQTHYPPNNGKKELREAIYRNYDRLSEEIRTELPLKRIWTLVEEAG